MDFIPERSELQVDNLELKDKVVRDMVRDIGLKKLIPGKKERRAAAEWISKTATSALFSKDGILARTEWGKKQWPKCVCSP